MYLMIILISMQFMSYKTQILIHFDRIEILFHSHCFNISESVFIYLKTEEVGIDGMILILPLFTHSIMAICSTSGNGYVSVNTSHFLLRFHTVLLLTSGQHDLHYRTVMTAFWLSHQTESGQQISSKKKRKGRGCSACLNWLMLVLVIWSGISELWMSGLRSGGLTGEREINFSFRYSQDSLTTSVYSLKWNISTV